MTKLVTTVGHSQKHRHSSYFVAGGCKIFSKIIWTKKNAKKTTLNNRCLIDVIWDSFTCLIGNLVMLEIQDRFNNYFSTVLEKNYEQILCRFFTPIFLHQFLHQFYLHKFFYTKIFAFFALSFFVFFTPKFLLFLHQILLSYSFEWTFW